MLGLYFGRLRHLSFEAGLRIIDQLEGIAKFVQNSLECDLEITSGRRKVQRCKQLSLPGASLQLPDGLGRSTEAKGNQLYPCGGVPAAEMKHGPIALVDAHTPSVFIISRSAVLRQSHEQSAGSQSEGGAGDSDYRSERRATDASSRRHHPNPLRGRFFAPIVASVPLQLLAYHIAVLRGCDVDKPRNLAKSVTVE